MQAASAPQGGGLTIPPAALSPARQADKTDPVVTRAAAEMRLRLRHDLMRLKQIKSTALKIAAKREMLPAYDAWIDGELEAGRKAKACELAVNQAADVLPTIMVWCIDTANWPRALELAGHVLRFKLPLPDRYKRDAASLIVEEISEAAFQARNSGNAFPLDVLETVEELTFGIDMHDEIQAKLAKAIGMELAAIADKVSSSAEDFIVAAEAALLPLRRAQELNGRAGTKGRIGQLERAISAALKESENSELAPRRSGAERAGREGSSELRAAAGPVPHPRKVQAHKPDHKKKAKTP